MKSVKSDDIIDCFHFAANKIEHIPSGLGVAILTT